MKSEVRRSQQKLALNKKRLLELLALVQRRQTEIVEAFYDIGDALEEITRKELYRTDGCASFDAWLKKHKLMSDVQARKFITISLGMSRENALTAGPERAYELVRLAAEDPEINSADALTRADAKIAGKLVREMSVDDLAAHRRGVRKKTGEQPAENPKRRAQDLVASELQQRLRKAGATGATARAIHTAKHWVVEIIVRASDAARVRLSAKTAEKKRARP